MAARHLQATDHYAKPNRTNRAGSSSTKTMHHRTLAAALLLAFPPAALSQSSEPPDIKELSSVVLHLSGPSTPIAPWSASEWTLTIANGGQSSLPFSPESLGIHGYRGVRISVQVQQVPSPEGGGQGLKSSDAPGSSNEELPWLTLPANPFEHGHSQGGTTTGIKYGERKSVDLLLHGRLVSKREYPDSGAPVVSRRFQPLFPEPGDFKVRIFLRTSDGDAYSSPALIRVAKCSPQESAALAAFKELSREGIILDPRGYRLKTQNDWVSKTRDFIQVHAGSPYAEYLSLGFARSLLSPYQSASTLGNLPLQLRDQAKPDIELAKTCLNILGQSPLSIPKYHAKIKDMAIKCDQRLLIQRH